MKEATSVREALRQWEEEYGLKAHEASDVKLIGLYPPIEKTDPSLQTLVACEKLSLSTNCLEKIGHMSTLTNLKILSLSRNNIKSLSGLEVVGETLEQLWISYNQIEKLKGINSLKKLKVLYISNNLVKDWAEFMKLAEVPTIEELNFVGNALEEKQSLEGTWRAEVEKRLASLGKLDGLPVIRVVDEATFVYHQHKTEHTAEGAAADGDGTENGDAEKNNNIKQMKKL